MGTAAKQIAHAIRNAFERLKLIEKRSSRVFRCDKTKREKCRRDENKLEEE